MITVLRLGHRRGRDDRISTHVGLTARQFGADRIIFAGERDDNMLTSLRDVADRWGGGFDIAYEEAWRPIVRGFDGTAVHLTMYGVPYHERLDAVEAAEDLLIVVGAEKVPPELYDMVDYNLSVGNQPHSEVAALAVFLHDLHGGIGIDEPLENADIRVIPQEQGKKTEEQ